MYRPEDMRVQDKLPLKHWKDWFRWGSTDVKESISSRRDENMLRFYNLL